MSLYEKIDDHASRRVRSFPDHAVTEEDQKYRVTAGMFEYILLHHDEKNTLKECVEGVLQAFSNDEPSIASISDEEFVEDGFGSSWSKRCPDCGEMTIEVIRPGKAQCCNCG